MQIHDTFALGLDPRWQITQTGTGSVIRRPGSLHLTLIPDDAPAAYHNAQITEYVPAKRDFQCQPPLRLTVRACASLHPANLVGTAGFGFWNHALEPGQARLGRPQALWFFFGAPPNNIALAKGVPGHGWKAATFDAHRWQFAALAPLAPLGMALMRNRTLYNALWGIGQNALGVQEALLDSDLLNSEHEYVLEWRRDGATFLLDGQVVQQVAQVPQNPLGFVAWMDNQYQVVTPQGQFAGGVVPVKRPQALMLSEIKIEPL
ncbi:MAG: hypothetical protein MUE40_16610 [Anaerolineae bacterium]|jgi:hypothetical protein|nr:hypothetical protein [Anaerolineae bacterium]